MKRTGAIACLVFVTIVISGFAQDLVREARDNPDNYMEVVGTAKAKPNQPGLTGYIPTRKAADVDAYRQIPRKILDLRLNSETTVKDLGPEMAAQVTSSIGSEGTNCVAVDDETALHAAYTSSGELHVHCWIQLAGVRGVLPLILDTIEPVMARKLEDQHLSTRPTPAPSIFGALGYDALIVHVPAPFKPSIFPTIRTANGELVYSVANRVSLEIQKDRGLAQFTNDTAKAKIWLTSLGAKKILTVNAAARTTTDAQIQTADADKILAADKEMSFLEDARVVFVMASPRS